MRTGLFTPFTNPFATLPLIRAVAEQADARGFHSMWLAEHVVLFDKPDSSYPYSPDGKLNLGSDTGILEPFTTMGFLAACTSRIRLGTGICLLPQRNPVYTAKEVSNLDYLSNGRIDLGIGIGWLREEFEALGVDWARRGARTDEYVQILKTLWCDKVSKFDGEFHTLPPCTMFPKPVHQPHPPIYVGGESDAALGRVARLGQGWHGFNHTPQTAAERIGKLRGLLSGHGRPVKDVDITVAIPAGMPLTIEDVKRYCEAGVDQLTIPIFPRNPDAARMVIDDLAKRILEPAAAL